MSKVTFPSFDRRATAILAALESLDGAASKCADAIQATMMAFIDEVYIATGKRDEATCKALGKAIRESQVFIDAVAQGMIEKTTITNYAQGAMRALHYNVAWAPRLFQDSDMRLPWSKKPAAEKAEGTKGSATDAKKAGKVQTTTDKELLDTMRKAIQQARLLNRHLTVGLLIDAAQEIDAEFKE